MGGHRYNRPLLIASAIVCALTWYMGWKSVGYDLCLPGM